MSLPDLRLETAAAQQHQDFARSRLVQRRDRQRGTTGAAPRRQRPCSPDAFESQSRFPGASRHRRSHCRSRHGQLGPVVRANTQFQRHVATRRMGDAGGPGDRKRPLGAHRLGRRGRATRAAGVVDVWRDRCWRGASDSRTAHPPAAPRRQPAATAARSFRPPHREIFPPTQGISGDVTAHRIDAPRVAAVPPASCTSIGDRST